MTTKLSDKYDVKIPAAEFPRFKIINVSDKLDDETLVDKIRNQNDFLTKEAHLTVIKQLDTTRNSHETYTVILEADTNTFNEIIRREKISVGWDRCRVFVHTYVARCYRCLGFNHTSKVCTKKQSCVNCGGEHEQKNCTSKVTKCVNCLYAVEHLGLKLNINHNAYSMECSVLERRLEQERERRHQQ